MSADAWVAAPRARAGSNVHVVNCILIVVDAAYCTITGPPFQPRRITHPPCIRLSVFFSGLDSVEGEAVSSMFRISTQLSHLSLHM